MLDCDTNDCAPGTLERRTTHAASITTDSLTHHKTSCINSPNLQTFSFQELGRKRLTSSSSMSGRFATLSSIKRDDDDGDDDGRMGNEYYAGGHGQGGSGTMIYGRAPPRPRSFRVELFRNGFRLNGGPLRATQGDAGTDANRRFVEQLKRRELPRELEEAARAAGLEEDVPVDVVDRSSEVYDDTAASGSAPAAAAASTSFEGSGRKLGGASRDEGEAATAAVLASSAAEAAPAAVVDPARPKTVIQVRLHSGKRERVTLNLHHTVAQLVALVRKLDACGGKPFTLLAGFPPRPVADLSMTIEAAGLQGATVQQEPLAT